MARNEEGKGLPVLRAIRSNALPLLLYAFASLLMMSLSIADYPDNRFQQQITRILSYAFLVFLSQENMNTELILIRMRAARRLWRYMLASAFRDTFLPIALMCAASVALARLLGSGILWGGVAIYVFTSHVLGFLIAVYLRISALFLGKERPLFLLGGFIVVTALLPVSEFNFTSWIVINERSALFAPKLLCVAPLTLLFLFLGLRAYLDFALKRMWGPRARCELAAARRSIKLGLARFTLSLAGQVLVLGFAFFRAAERLMPPYFLEARAADCGDAASLLFLNTSDFPGFSMPTLDIISLFLFLISWGLLLSPVFAEVKETRGFYPMLIHRYPDRKSYLTHLNAKGCTFALNGGAAVLCAFVLVRFLGGALGIAAYAPSPWPVRFALLAFFLRLVLFLFFVFQLQIYLQLEAKSEWHHLISFFIVALLGLLRSVATGFTSLNFSKRPMEGLPFGALLGLAILICELAIFRRLRHGELPG